MDTQAKKLDFKTIFFYSCGDFGSCLMYYLISMYFMFYCTNILGISLAAAGSIVFICRIWDAINDIAVGALVDRTKHKAGKAKPWIKWFIIPCVFSYVFIFACPEALSQSGKILWVGIGYFLFALFYTTVNLPYGSLIPLITKDSTGRVKLSQWRMVGAFSGIVILSMTALPMIDFFEGVLNSKAMGYTAVSVIYAIIAFVLFSLLYKNVHELDEGKYTKTEITFFAKKETKERSFFQELSCLVKNKAWVIIFFITLAGYISNAIAQTTIPYYFIYVFKAPEAESAIYSTLSMAAGLVILPFADKVIAKFGYKKTLMTSFLGVAISSLVGYFFPYDRNIILVTYIIRNFFIGLPNVALRAMLANTLEWTDLHFNIRLDGLGFAADSFSTKAGPAIGSLLMTGVMLITGLNTSVSVGGYQTGLALEGLKWTFSLLPAVIAGLQALLAFFYPLTEDKYAEVVEGLRLRDEAAKAAKAE